LVRFRLSVSWLDIDDFHHPIFVINPVAAFSGTQVKAGPLDNMAKIVKAEVLRRARYPGARRIFS
jgi:hypothetical protein